MHLKLLDEEYLALRTKGLVYLLRRRKKSNRKVKIYYNGEKIGMGILNVIGVVEYNCKTFTVNDKKIDLYLKYSGFDSVRKWISKIKRVCGQIKGLTLYELKIVKFF